MTPFHATTWPVTLAQTDDSPAPASAPLDTSPPPAAASEGAVGEAASQTPGGAATDPNTAPPPSPFGGGFVTLMILMIGLMLLFTMSSGRKEKKRKAEIMANLSKGAKVQTVGGVLGTVVEVRDDEVTVKVDESSNTRMRFTKSAISAVTSED